MLSNDLQEQSIPIDFPVDDPHAIDKLREHAKQVDNRLNELERRVKLIERRAV